MALRAFATVCDDGDCPTFYIDDETEDVYVRGADPDDPTRERNVRIGRADWARLIAQIPR